MIDKEKIRSEIKRRRDDILSKVHHYPLHRIELLDELLSFIDSLPEEHCDRLRATEEKSKKEISWFLRDLRDNVCYMYSGNIAHNKPPALNDIYALGKILYKEGLFDVENPLLREEFGLPEINKNL